MFFYLKISCKDKKVLKKFISFFIKIKSLFIKSFPINKKRKFVTVLKSPHVNKTAQEQFEYRFFSKNFIIFSFKPFVFFLLLKRLKNFSFSGIKFEIRGLSAKKKTDKHILKLINPDNIVFRNIYFKSKVFGKSTFLKEIKFLGFKKNEISGSGCNNYTFDFIKKYIQSFDSYGEICLQSIFYLP